MKALHLRYDRRKFWEDYWKEFSVDREEFVDLGMYPIDLTLEHVRPDSKILECGFGGGRVVRHLAKRGYDVEGIEYDPQIVEKLKQADPSLRVRQGDILRMNFPDDRFDVSLCFGVISGLETGLAAAVSELKRVTRPGGVLIVSVMLKNLGRRLQKALRGLSRHEEGFYAWMDTEEGWRNLFRAFDLECLEARPMVSRYNVYYWAKFLRSRKPTDLTLARVQDEGYRLNLAGECAWRLHKHFLRRSFAGALNFALRNRK